MLATRTGEKVNKFAGTQFNHASERFSFRICWQNRVIPAHFLLYLSLTRCLNFIDMIKPIVIDVLVLSILMRPEGNSTNQWKSFEDQMT